MSVRQIKALIDYMESHPKLAHGYFTRTKEGRNLSKALWTDCAKLLNSVSIGCTQKSGDDWRLFYNNYKHQIVKKIKANKAKRAASGGELSKINCLTPLQGRLCSILGWDVGESKPKRIFVKIEEEFDDQQKMYEVNDQQTIEVKDQQKIENDRVRNQETTTESEPEEDISIRQATQMLQSIEDMRARATLEHAKATHRLAQAIETIAEILKNPPEIKHKVYAKKSEMDVAPSDNE